MEPRSLFGIIIGADICVLFPSWMLFEEGGGILLGILVIDAELVYFKLWSPSPQSFYMQAYITQYRLNGVHFEDVSVF